MNIIARKGNIYLVTNKDNIDLSSVFEKGYIVNENGQVLSPILPIGVLTKDGYWESFSDEYENCIKEDKNYVKNALLGAAMGDAFGVPYEFLTRKEIEKLELNDMIGSDVAHNFESLWGKSIPSGCWSDDTSMIVASMDSIIEKGTINYDDLMYKYYSWWHNGDYSSTPLPFGLGHTVSDALKRYNYGVPPLYCGGRSYMDNGNGSLMRILPFSLYCIMNNFDNDQIYSVIARSSALTHAHEISVMACMMYTKMLAGAIKYRNPKLAFDEILTVDYNKYFSPPTVKKYQDLLDNVLKVGPNQIGETGYVVDSLKAAIYSLLMGDSFESTIKKCVKLGYDTDTNACIAGSIAGIIYGMENVPKNWIQKLKRREYLEKLADEFQNRFEKVKGDETITI